MSVAWWSRKLALRSFEGGRDHDERALVGRWLAAENGTLMGVEVVRLRHG
jgi:hypothetical protein